MKDKKKILWIVLAVILVCVLAAWFISQKDIPETKADAELSGDSVNQIATEKNQGDGTEAKEEKDLSGDVSEKEIGSTVNAYEYILFLMSRPQYWSEDEYFPLYSANYLEDEARETLIDGTGWKLSDEKTASFTRGYEGELTICFSEHTAVSKDTTSGYCYSFDFKNDKYLISLDGEVQGEFQLNREAESYENSSFGMLERTFTYYEEMFSVIGCPLLEKKEGTLSSYKNRNVNKISAEDDGLIHAVWEEEVFSFSWEETDISWISDYREIADKKVPESKLVSSTVEYLDGHKETFSAGIYSPLFLVLADRSSSEKYSVRDGSVWFEDISFYDNITESFAAHFLAPAMERVYGYNAVYFTDVKKLTGSLNPKLILTKEDFDKGLSYDYESGAQLIMEILPLGNNFVYMSYTADSNYMLFHNLVSAVKDVYSYYGISYPYADDYLGNFILVYSLDDQRLLGLR